jgi:tetratricopeptide (TPR) repeat protein
MPIMATAHLPCSEAVTPSNDEILQQLGQILSNRRFASAERNANFLRYIVNAVIEGKRDELKEVVIAMEIYGRSTDYDPKIDSIVRVEATRLRAKLQSYYEQEGREDAVRITIPKGSYVPCFERVAPIESPALEPESRRPLALEHELPKRYDQGDGGSRFPSRARVRSASLGLIGRGRVRRIWLPSALLLVLTFVGLSGVGNAQKGEKVDPEGLAAWQEGNDLLRQDPHNSSSDYGAPLTLRRAIERYEFAVANSPRFADAWASLAEAYEYASAYVGRDRDQDARRAEMAARRAVALNEKLAYSHAMLALILSYIKWDFAGAESAYRKAIAMDPHNVYAIVEYVDLLRQTGRLEQAANEIHKARALLPAMQVLAVKEAELHLDQKRPEAAIATAKAAVELGHNYPRAHVVLGMAWEAKTEFERALAEYRKALAINENDRHALPAYGYLLAVMGRREEARSVARQLEDMNTRIRNCAFQVSVVYAGLGEQERALAWFERAYQTRQAAVPLAATAEYRLNSLRRYPQFDAIIRQLGLRTVAPTHSASLVTAFSPTTDAT